MIYTLMWVKLTSYIHQLTLPIHEIQYMFKPLQSLFMN